MTRRRLIELSPLEEALLLWHEANAVWSFQFGVTAPRLDPERVRQAYNTALAHHPLGRCGIESDSRGRFQWIEDSDADIGEVEVVECPDEETLQQVFLEQIDRPMPLDQAPLARALIARCPTEDILSSQLNHVFVDGLGTLRLLRSVARAYRGEFDPPPAVDIATAHRALDPLPASDWAALTKQWTTRLELAATALTERSRLAPSGGAGVGAGSTIRSFPAAPLLEASRAHNASFGTYSMAAMHLTVERWNHAHDAACDHVGVTQAVNLRPDEWWDDTVANLAAMTSVLTKPSDRRDMTSALTVVRPQVESSQRKEKAREFVAAAKAARMVPFALRRQAFAAAARQQFDTCVLSNLRQVPDPPRFGDDHETVISATTAAMPGVGLTLGVYTAFDELRFLVIYRRETFDRDGANAFVDAFIETLRNG